MTQAISEGRPPGGMWRHALWLAERTPAKRNRYVDFLRALSILAVVLGHWMISAPYFADGSPAYSHLLDLAPWSRWLTWVFQVMPIFFFVGGFSNGVSWDAARSRGGDYRSWFDARLRRLLAPVLPLVLVWAMMTAVAHANGVSAGMIRVGSQVALVPVWFLAVYLMVVALVPLSFAAWRRWGFLSVVVPVTAAALVDVAFFAGGLHLLGWLNYPLIWLAVHQLGYAWHEGRLGGPLAGLGWFVLGAGALVALTRLGPYPVSLVGVPSEEVSNTLPPKLPLLALGAAQIGLVLMLEKPVRRWLERPIPWAVTILVNGMIMTIFLWHSTVMMLLIGLAFWQLPVVLTPMPDTTHWWWMRPLWIAAYAVATVPFLLVFARFERPSTSDDAAPAPVLLQLIGCAIACLGLSMLALDGIGGNGWLGLRWVPLLTPLIGAGLAGLMPVGFLPTVARKE